ncbi:Gfo/Idh/MocA family oxidoreductase [Microbacterium sp.]|uniref:Gfo/Idh/MocA family protein n=1 Tax=Microbacterium sp. TaxID=51671 RepID=UPI0025D4B3D0|nr:Gfo/Idh/MocA family oxidoreductase [Microbacterium sp.]
MAVLRAGLLGVGMMGRHHARVLRELDGVELVAIADPGGDPYAVAGRLAVLPGLDELIATGIDIAVVAVPTRYHEDAALTLAAAGVHTLVEKPIADSLEAAERIVDAFAAAGLVGAVGHIERFNPALQELRRRLEAGELGPVYQIQTRRQGPFPSRIADVGVAKDLATHDVDLTAWVAQSTYARVFAQTTFKSGREHEDMIAITGRLTSGIIVNHLVNWMSPMKERVAVVTGERGAFVADTATGDLTFYANGTIPLEWESVSAFRGVSEGDIVRYAIPKREPLRVELEAFRDAVRGVAGETVTMEQGLSALRVVEAALASAREGVAIAL